MSCVLISTKQSDQFEFQCRPVAQRTHCRQYTHHQPSANACKSAGWSTNKNRRTPFIIDDFATRGTRSKFACTVRCVLLLLLLHTADHQPKGSALACVKTGSDLITRNAEAFYRNAIGNEHARETRQWASGHRPTPHEYTICSDLAVFVGARGTRNAVSKQVGISP